MGLAVTTYTDNRPTPAPATTVGFKISKPGYDAGKTAGNNFVFDSSWPSLPIAFQQTVMGGLVNVTHNLNYPPFTMMWVYGTDTTGQQVWRRFFPSVDSTTVYQPGSLTFFDQNFVNSATRFHVKCFQIDITKDIDYALAPGDTYKYPYDPNFGVKVALPNKSITSKDLRDYSIHSRAQSPLLLAVKNESTIPAGQNAIQYTAKYTYPVWFYGYAVQNTGTYVAAPYYSQGYPRLFTNGTTGYIQQGGGSYVNEVLIVLRDPMFAATQTTVQY